jgi:hypothetical protein
LCREESIVRNDLPSDPLAAQPFATTLRIVSQVIGLGLILAGSWYALSIIATAIKIARQPSESEPALVEMAKTLKLEGATAPMGEGDIAVDRSASVVALLLWYLLSALISVLLINAGGRLVLGVVSERREFLSAMKEFLVTLRSDGSGEHKST